MNRSAQFFGIILATVMLLSVPIASAQTKDDLAQKILKEVAAGRNAAELIKEYQKIHPSVGSPYLDRTVEIRQLNQAEKELIETLRSLQSRLARASGSVNDATAQASAAYQQWKAAALLIASQQKTVENKLTAKGAGSTYQSRHQEMVKAQRAREQSIQQLLDPYLSPDPADVSSKSITGSIVSSALAMLIPKNEKRPHEPVLRANGLPVGSLNLPTRAPKTAPAIKPSYLSGTEIAATADDIAGAAEAPLSDEIVRKAHALENDYVRIYEFVRNTSRTELYAGSVKGALGTLRSGAGNDVDQASLLIALLRAAGIPSRYVRGVIELPVEKIAADLGLQDVAQVSNALTKAGIAFTPVVRGGRVALVQIEHTWVAALVPYSNYRGAAVDGSGKTWIPLDPSYKAVQRTAAKVALNSVGTAAGLQEEYLAQVPTQSFAEFLKKRVTDALQAGSGIAVDYLAQLGSIEVKPLSLSLLPNSLPYPVIAATTESARLPDADTVSARIVIRTGADAGSKSVLDATFPVHELSNQRFTLSYLPATLEDHRTALLFGGMDAVPLYLIQLRPQLNIGGSVRAIAKEPVAPGSDLTLEIELTGPFGTQRIAQNVMAGPYQALAIGGASISRPAVIQASDTETQAARLLDGIANSYHQAWVAGENQIAALTGVSVLRPVPSVTVVSNLMKTEYLGNVPQTLVWQGVTLDAQTHPVEAIGANAKEFMALSGLHGSSLEFSLFESQFSVGSISADKGLALAQSQGIAVLHLTQGNIASIDASDHGTAVKNHIKNLARLGYRVNVPASRITYMAWSGSVWRAIDDATGASGYFISGGLAGGASAAAPGAWPLDFLADALSAQDSDPYNSDPLAGVTVFKIGSGDEQTGTVGQQLPVPYSVMVQDKDGRPVKGARVTFTVKAGDGRVNGESSYLAQTSALGIATVSMTLGKKTGSNPRYILLDQGDDAATQVGLNVVEVTAESAQGTLLIDSTFLSIGKPDVMSELFNAPGHFLRNNAGASTWIDTLAYVAQDQFANPLANVRITFSITSQLACQAAAGGFKQGVVFDAVVKDDGYMKGCSSHTPVLGDCGSSSFNAKSDSRGFVFSGVIVSNDPTGSDTVTIQGGGFTKDVTYYGQGSCREIKAENDSGSRYRVFASGLLGDGDGHIISAAKPGERIKHDLTATAYHIANSPGEINYERTNSDLAFFVSSGGASVSGSGQGQITGVVRVAGAPDESIISVRQSGSYTDSGGNPHPYLSYGPIGPVYAVIPKIEKIVDEAGATVEKILIDKNSLSASQLLLQYKIEPDSYYALSADMDLYEDGQRIGVVVGTKKTQGGNFLLPRGIQFDVNKTYESEFVLNRGSQVEIKSSRFSLPIRQKLIRSVSQSVRASLEVDALNRRACDRPGGLNYNFTQPVTAKLEIQELDASGTPLGSSPRELFKDVSYGEGGHTYTINAGQLGTGEFRYTLTVTGVQDPSQVEVAIGAIKTTFQAANRMPVGQVIIKGVNVKDGSLVAQAQSMALPGRGPGLNFRPTYSSAANGQVSHMGANWSHNLDGGVHVNSCGDVVVSAGDAGSVRFFPNNDGTLKPDAGYHGTMIKNNADHTFDFYSKDGTRYHYTFFNERVQWKLAFVEDTNGNTVTYNYDMNAFPDPRVVSVKDSAGRELTIQYIEKFIQSAVPGAGGHKPLVQKVTGPDGLQMTFDYDDYGNLVSVDRNGRKETFGYNVTDPDFKARSLLKSYTDPNGNVTGYTYNQMNVSVATGGGALILLPNSMVTEVKTPTGAVGFAIDAQTFQRTTVTDENGKSTVYDLNMYGSPLTITDPAGTTKMTWSATDIVMLSKTNARDITTDFTYDTEGNMLSETTAGLTTTHTYLVQTAKPFIKNKKTSTRDRNGNLTSYSYDGKGNLLEENHPEGMTIRHSYAGDGDRLQTTDGNGGITRFGYDSAGNLTSTTDPVSAVTTMVRDGRGRVTSSKDALGNVTSYTYDQQDRVLTRTDPKGKVHRTTYDDNGNKLTETDEANRTTTWKYNGINLPTEILNADAKLKKFTYDGVGNKLSETDFRNNLTTYLYDGVNRLVKRTEPLGKTTDYVYDPVGNVTSETDGLSRTTSHTYDDLNRRTGTTDAMTGQWSMTYDGNGNKLTSVDPLTRTTTFTYDGLNRLTKVAQPLGRTTTTTYDKNGNKLTEIDPNGNVTKYEYDAANRLIKSTDANDKQTGYAYDKNDNLLQTIDPMLNVINYSYDQLNRKRDMRDAEGYVTAYQYDAVGNLIEELHPNDNQVVHTYDALNRRIATNDSIGRVGTWDYDADGNKTAESDANGNTTYHTYNELSQLTQTDMPEGRSVSYVNDVMGNRTSMRDARGYLTTYKYDDLNRLTETTDAKLGVLKTSYDKVGNKLSVTNKRNYVTTYVYDDLNRMTTATDALSQVVSTTYDAVGNKVSETDKRGTVTQHKYDKLNRLLSVTKDGVMLSKNQYDDAGNLVFVTDAKGNTTDYTYDRRKLRIGENRLLAAITKFKLDSMGDTIEVTDPEGRKTTTSYDKRRRPTAVTNNAGETTLTAYDLAGNHLSSTRPLNNATTMTYDGANRLRTIVDSINGTTRYGYDNADNHTVVTDANNNTTTYTYDELNRRTGIAYPGGATESFGFDANGNLTSHTDGNGVVVGHVFDALDRETNKTFSASADGLSSIVTGYDANNNVIQVTQTMNGVPQVSSYSFDRFDRLEKHADPFGAQSITTYDANGNKTSLITQDGKITRYSYDVLNRLSTIVGQSGTINYSYDRSSLNTAIKYSNGVTTTHTHDAAKRIKSVIHAKGGSILSRTDYDYDKNGNRLKETINRIAGAQVTTYTYDTADRLDTTTVIDAAKTVATDYTLDAVANRTAETVTTTPVSGSPTTVTKGYTYDGRNQLTGITDSVAGPTTLTYDNQGNLIQKVKGSDVTNYSYNARDNLIKVSKNATVLGTYGNDHLGLRVVKEAVDPLQPGAPPVTRRTLWDGRNAFQDSDTDGAVVSRYENNGRTPVSMWDKNDGVQALHQDALGSVVATTDTLGSIKSETIYDAFGNVVETTGQSANKFGYTGHQMDKESGLIYFQARYYDPETGRFITQDPYEGDWRTPLSLHHYLYAYANPTTYIDLYGYESVMQMIDRGAEGCGAVSCAGWALLHGVYRVGTLGFADVHDKAREAYDDGKISGSDYVKYGIGGGAAVVGVNAVTGRVGGSLITGTIGKKIVTSAVIGATNAAATDAISQGSEIATGQREQYDVAQTGSAAKTGALIGGAVPAVATGAQKAANKYAAHQANKAAAAESAASVKPPVTEPPQQPKTEGVSSKEKTTIESPSGAGTQVASPSGPKNSAPNNQSVAPEAGNPELIRYKPREGLTAKTGSRETAIDRAWVLEKQLIEKTGKGTRNWSEAEKELIKSTKNGDLTKMMSEQGYTGHHINSVKNNGALGDKWKGDPRNITFLENPRHPKSTNANNTEGAPAYNEHYHSPQGHRGDTGNVSKGRLIDREAMIKAAERGE